MFRITAAISIALSTLGSCNPTVPPQPTPVETWAFCGVHPDDPIAQKKAITLSTKAGVDATFGPCMPPSVGYTAANPGSRYISPTDYLRLTVINANAGMKTVVYDARIWSDDPSIRNEAIAFWAPHTAWVAAFDMGDEYDPSTPDWAILKARWEIVRTHITPVLGVKPFTNHLGSEGILAQSLIDLPGSEELLSFDAYPEVGGKMVYSLDLASKFNAKTKRLMCAINALPHGSFNPTTTSTTRHIKDHKAAGCDMILIFGGERPISTPGFERPSLITSSGSATSLASVFLNHAK